MTITPEFTAAIELIENTSQHLFITGKAGTGKSTLLNHVRATTKKKIAVLAPTGVAAINVQGQTVHSFFRLRPDITAKTVKNIRYTVEQIKTYKALDTIIIDEVSMLRADLLDSIDAILRLHGPNRGRVFGGIQMIFIGDLYQLPPVVTTRDRELFYSEYKSPYFFDAKVMSEVSLSLIELQTVYRQNDDTFIEILNAIRTNTSTPHHLSTLNNKHNPTISLQKDQEWTIYLTTTNEVAHSINEQKLHSLASTPFIHKGVSTGTFQEKDFPTHQELVLKPESQVMFLTNDSSGRWVNGTLGKIKRIYDDPEEEFPIVEVTLDSGRTVKVTPYTWEIFRYNHNAETEELDTETLGTFRQYPLRLAWAVTIHKSQGKTFDKVIIDIGRGTFSPGQLYVALSRCRTLDGITLKQYILPRHIITDPKIGSFFTSFNESVRKLGQDSFDFFEEWN